MRQEEIDNAELIRAKTALDGITRFVNNYGHSDELFAKLLMREHRTLQQSVMRLFMACIEEWLNRSIVISEMRQLSLPVRKLWIPWKMINTCHLSNVK